MKILVSGMRNPENIRAVNELGVDLIGLIFYKNSSRFVPLANSRAGIIPDRAVLTMTNYQSLRSQFVGVFFDEMLQTVITNVYNYHLDYVQLNGEESTIYIDNLRSTIDPDIHAGIKIIKCISVYTKDDFEKATYYEGHADLLLFDIQCSPADGSFKQLDLSILDSYNGNMPFILSADIGLDEVERVKSFHHPQFFGVDLGSKFEKSPAVIDIEKLKKFIDCLHS